MKIILHKRFTDLRHGISRYFCRKPSLNSLYVFGAFFLIHVNLKWKYICYYLICWNTSVVTMTKISIIIIFPILSFLSNLLISKFYWVRTFIKLCTLIGWKWSPMSYLDWITLITSALQSWSESSNQLGITIGVYC